MKRDNESQNKISVVSTKHDPGYHISDCKDI